MDDENKKKAILLTKVSVDTYTLISNLCAPTKPKDKNFKDLVKLVKKYLSPTPSEAMERCKFHQATQSTTESVAEFSAKLKKLAVHCNFEKLDDALRDQLICSFREHDSRVKLFREEKLTYDKAYKMAIGRETANKNVATTGAKELAQLTAKVNMISDSGASKPREEKGNRGRSQRQRRESNRGRSFSRGRGRGKSSGPPLTCFRCGGKNYWSTNCKYRSRSCNKYGKKGICRLYVGPRNQHNRKR